MMKASVWILAAALSATPRLGIACGVCIDDKVAAVYDHAVVQQAMATGRVVVFCEVAGPSQPQALAPQARRAAQALRGVDRASVRSSDELPVLSFALDPARQSPAAALAGLRQRLAADGISITLLRVLEAGQDGAQR